MKPSVNMARLRVVIMKGVEERRGRRRGGLGLRRWGVGIVWGRGGGVGWFGEDWGFVR